MELKNDPAQHQAERGKLFINVCAEATCFAATRCRTSSRRTLPGC
jgi:hypothetical protein